MHKYIEDLTDLISNCSMDNTYKMSWCRALVEYSYNNTEKKVHFDKLSELIFKYYWDQTIFFNLDSSYLINLRSFLFLIFLVLMSKIEILSKSSPTETGTVINIL